MKVSFNMKWLNFRVNITPKTRTELPELGQLAMQLFRRVQNSVGAEAELR